MSNPKDALGVLLHNGDSAELIEEVVIEGGTLSKGTVLRRLKHWHNDTQVEFNGVQVEGRLEDKVIPTKSLKKI